jgi:hypothetical protein
MIRVLLPGLTLLALVLACFSRLVIEPDGLVVDPIRPSIDLAFPGQSRTVGNDLTDVFLPRYAAIVTRLREHASIPVWDDSGFAGRPLVGNPQSGLFYPPVWIAWAVGRHSALGWLTVAHLYCAGIGTYVLARRLGIAAPAAVVAGACFEASPYLIAHAFEGHYPHVWSVCWYPWAFWGVLEMRKGRIGGSLALPIFLALSFLSGHVQEWYYLVVTLSAWAVGEGLWLVVKRDRAEGMSRLLGWFGLLGLAIAFCGSELLPDMAAQPWTLRTGKIALRQIDRYHLHALNLLQLLSPSALGGPNDYFGHDNYWETVFSTGLIPLILGLIGIAKHPRRRVVQGWLLLAVLSSIFAAGRKLGLYALAYRLLPGMDHFRVPSRTLFLASLAASVLVGFGADILLGSDLDRAAWLRLRKHVSCSLVVVSTLVISLGAMGYIAYGYARASDGHARSPNASTLLDSKPPSNGLYREARAALTVATEPQFWMTMGAMVLAWHLFGVGAGGRRATAYMLSTLVWFELAVSGYAILIVSPPERFVSHDTIARQLADLRNEETGPARVASVGSALGDLDASLLGLEKTNINDGFQLQIAADLYERLYWILDPLPIPKQSERPMDAAVAAFQMRVARSVLDRLSVRYLVSDRGSPIPGLEPVDLPGPLRVYRNPSTLPRAYVVPQAAPVHADARTVASQLSDVDPMQWVTMNDEPLRGVSGDRQPFTQARWRSNPSGGATVNVETSHPGLLVVGTTWMPGWQAHVDGHKIEVLVGNHCQQVVPLVSAGRHVIELSFTPPWLREGIAMTVCAGVSWILLATVLIVNRNGRRPRWRESPGWIESVPLYDRAQIHPHPRSTALDPVEEFEQASQTQP